jgi:hypothetical protein
MNQSRGPMVAVAALLCFAVSCTKKAKSQSAIVDSISEEIACRIPVPNCTERFEVGVHNDSDGIEFEIPRLSATGIVLNPNMSGVSDEIKNSRVARSIGTIWNLEEFRFARIPVKIAEISNRNEFSKPRGVRVLDLPIKLPSTDVRLPSEVKDFAPVVQSAMNVERALNPAYDTYYAYLTIDQGLVKKGQSQRRSGLHVDGFQGRERAIKSEIEHSYLAADRTPTVFYNQAFYLAPLDPGKHNYFWEFDRQADPAKEYPLEPYMVYLADAYSVHRATEASETRHRTFFRITFSKIVYDRKGLSDNPMFPIQLPRVEKSFPKLQRYIPFEGKGHKRLAIGVEANDSEYFPWMRALDLSSYLNLTEPGAIYVRRINEAMSVADEIHVLWDTVAAETKPDGRLSDSWEPVGTRFSYELYLLKRYFLTKAIFHVNGKTTRDVKL